MTSGTTSSATSSRPCSKCGKRRQAKFFSGPRGKICTTCSKKSRSDATHRRRVGKTYGLLPGEYDTLFSYQAGACAICEGTRRQRLSVDHDHRDSVVRGLLCRLCNSRLLTAARDNPDILRRAADYLENPPAITAIGRRYASEEANNNSRQRRKRR
ncbi:endonuclease VII domain-containing protein [Nonomuraea sp. NPDC049129]|uniref:endonuclease VII domain-containing protein n=1 Tax=Nonomuraea sp. NPDC049129 TaxID=3155272 RepID=UPI0033F4E5DF